MNATPHSSGAGQNPAPAKKNQVLFVASSDDFEPMARAWLKDFPTVQFIPSPPPETIIDGIPELKPVLVLLDGRGQSNKTLEWAQTLKMAFPVPLVVFYDSTSTLEFTILKKNGADSLLHLYYDSEFIVDKLLELVNLDDDSAPPIGLLNPVAVEDLTTEVDLNFDVYVHLPGNQKSILVRRKGAALDQKLIDKVKSSHQNVYFKKSQIKLFMEYSRTAITLKNSNELVGVTDKILRIRQKIQEIISEFFDFESKDMKAGRVILENCEKILEEFEIKKWDSPQKAVRNMVLFTGRERTYYNDDMTLCVLAAGLGFLLDKKPEEIHDLAFAGLLHNVGIASMAHPILQPDLKTMNPNDKQEYITYPDRSVNKIKTKKMALSPTVSELISQHRESLSGGGFPKGDTSDFHHPLSRIMQFAFILMDLTQLEHNKARHTLKGAFAHLHEQMLAGNNLVDATILLTLKKKIDSLS